MEGILVSPIFGCSAGAVILRALAGFFVPDLHIQWQSQQGSYNNVLCFCTTGLPTSSVRL